jgi:hypothetical protein
MSRRLLQMSSLSYSISFNYLFIRMRSWDSSVSIVSNYRLDNQASIPSRDKAFFSLASVSSSALRTTQPPIQCVLEVLSLGVKHCWGVTLTTHLHLVPGSRMSRSYTFSSPCCLHGVAGQLFIKIVFNVKMKSTIKTLPAEEVILKQIIVQH